MNMRVDLPVIVVINRFSMDQLVEMGKQLQSLSTLPSIKLIKQVPFFPVQFYGLSDTSRLERKLLQEATRGLLETLDKWGVRASYQVVRVSHPSQLLEKRGTVIQTIAEFTHWFASLKTLAEAREKRMLVNE